ncbi:hypothetical protein ACJX0J_025365, partial [Zea mays]
KAKGSPAAATENALASTNNASQRRSPNTPVIGWPPVRAFRRNLATSSRASLEHQNGKKEDKPEQTTKRAPFVKINMDGIPIGRKIDLSALGSYDELSLSVDKLFRGLLAAQQDPLAAGAKECSQEEVAISGLLDGTGEYTLVYEDYEGDRVLVGDVPWGLTPVFGYAIGPLVQECTRAQAEIIEEEKLPKADENHVLDDRQLQPPVLEASPACSTFERQNVMQHEASVSSQGSLTSFEEELTSYGDNVQAVGEHQLVVSKESLEECKRDEVKRNIQKA